MVSLVFGLAFEASYTHTIYIVIILAVTAAAAGCSVFAICMQH